MTKTSNWARNKQRAIFNNTKPSLTDQAAARDTDINVIVKAYTVHGQAPGATQHAIPDADFTEMPDNLRDMIEQGRTLAAQMRKLPKELQGLTAEELLNLTVDELKHKLTPPAPTPAPTPAPPGETK